MFFFIFLTENCLACSVCNGGSPQEKLNAYLLTTGILGVMPLILGTYHNKKNREVYRATRTKAANGN